MRRGTMKEKKRFLVDERRLKVTRIERMIADFERMDVDLQHEITAEQNRARMHDPTNFAYPLFARAAISGAKILSVRLTSLGKSLKTPRWEAVDELNKLEMIEEHRRIPELTPTASMLTPLQRQVRSRGL